MDLLSLLRYRTSKSEATVFYFHRNCCQVDNVAELLLTAGWILEQKLITNDYVATCEILHLQEQI